MAQRDAAEHNLRPRRATSGCEVTAIEDIGGRARDSEAVVSSAPRLQAVLEVVPYQYRIIERLLFLGFIHHKRCIDRRVGAKIDAYLTIPSLSGRQTPHPFVQKTAELGLTTEPLRLVAAPEATAARIVSADQFLLVPEKADLTGKHVLVLDDTWTTGSRTQSAAERFDC